VDSYGTVSMTEWIEGLKRMHHGSDSCYCWRLFMEEGMLWQGLDAAGGTTAHYHCVQDDAVL
jgi:hypothetical protein